MPRIPAVVEMKIERSDATLGGESRAMRWRAREEAVRRWVGSRPHWAGEPTRPASSAAIATDEPVMLSEGLLRRLAIEPKGTGDCAMAGPVAGAEACEQGTLPPEIQILKAIVERLTGHALREVRLRDIIPPSSSPPALVGAVAASAAREGAEDVGFGLETDLLVTESQVEQMAFSARGVVVTTSGHQIQFDFALSMESETVRSAAVSLRLGDAAEVKDPLVLSLKDGTVELLERRFSFDLDADGRAERITALSPGAAMLARDTNGDGRITDGRELFGARTGDGFAELSAYDDDMNDWIDEGDAIFASLLLWRADGDSGGHPEPLSRHGVGAIYLGRVRTPFALTTPGGEIRGSVRESGIYLRQDGSVGAAHQIDLVVA